MSDIIQLLPDYVANQIAAGEVVQRPASIVKELLENSIDAQSTKVELIVREAGKNLIQVVDNGIGMSATDARMAFERHATSKIRTTDDIFSIVTKGFRGEALASIAAVSQVELRTKQIDAELGTMICIEGGVLVSHEPVQTSDGANFQVKNLFYNVPARRKFLKDTKVEFRHILNEFHRVSLPHHDIEFNLYHNEEPIFRLRKTTQIQRIIDVFGKRLQPVLVPIKEDIEWVKLHGYVAKPEGAKKSRGEQFFFVNNRYFKSPYLEKAVQEAFEGLLKMGYSPSFFLFLEISPEKIDINIHPQKTEIKFEDEHIIYALIRSTIKKALGIYNIAPSIDFDNDIARFDDIFRNSSTAEDNSFSESKINKENYDSKRISVPRDFNPFEQEPKASQQEVINLTEMYKDSMGPSSPSKLNLFEDEDEDFSEDLMRLPNGYWLLNMGENVKMIDPSRMYGVIYSQQKSEQKRSFVKQTLLYSLEYYLSDTEKHQYLSIADYLDKLGFEMILGEENVLRIDAIPEGLKETQVIYLLECVFVEKEFFSEEEFFSFYDKQLSKLSYKSRFDFLHKKDVENLVKEFIALGFPQYSSTGKVCFVELPLEELKVMFE
jgi:DNA mismatch repair protein mutL